MTEPRDRPLWQWVLLALSPALAYDALAALSGLSESVRGLSVMTGLFVPFLALGVLIVVANAFYKARNNPAVSSRVWFVLGFGVVNAVLWLGGCAMTIDGMSFH